MYYVLLSPLLFLGIRTLLQIYSSTLLDFSMYLTATNFFLQGGNPYLAVTPQVYPPAFLYIMTPFALLPVTIARVLWTSLSILSLFFSIRLLLPKFNIKGQIFFTFLALQLFPVKFALAQGQINFFVLLGFLLFYHFTSSKKNLKAAFTLATIIIMKLNPIILLIYLAIQKKFRIIYYTLAIIIILNLSIDFFTSHDLTFSFVQITLFRSVHLPLEYYNQSLPSLIGRLNLSTLSTHISLAILSLTTIASFRRYRHLDQAQRVERSHSNRPHSYSFPLFLTTILLISPITWQHYLFWSLPAFIYLVTQTKKPNIYLVALSFILININLKNPQPFENFQLIYSHATAGLLLLYFLIVKSTYKSGVSQRQSR